MIHILEGIDGTGKTTFASKIIKYSTEGFTVSYFYFQKKATPIETIRFWKNHFTSVLKELMYVYDVIIVDRSIISTVVYHDMNKKCLLDYFNLPKCNVIINYFEKVHDYSKVYLDAVELRKKYDEVMSFLEQNGFTVNRDPVIQDVIPLKMYHR